MAAEERSAEELLALVTKTKPVLLATDRVTVRGEAHFEHFKEDPVSAQGVFEFATGDTDGAVYTRRLKIKQEWKPLDCGWVEKLGLLFLKNNTGPREGSVPTEEEKQSLSRCVVEVWFNRTGDEVQNTPSNPLLIRPGRFLMFEPQSKDNIWLRCVEGEANLKLTAFPG